MIQISIHTRIFCGEQDIRCFRLIWIVLCLTFYFMRTTGGSSSEDGFFKVYGNEASKSGKWKAMRKERPDEAGFIINVCSEAHRKAELGSANVRIFGFLTTSLVSTNKSYIDIKLDIVKYAVALPNSTEPEDRFWYITKGLKKDCVFYVEPRDDSLKTVRLTDLHVCGIKELLSKSPCNE